MKTYKEDLTGKEFGKLKVLEYVHENGTSGWKCQCTCDNHTIVILPASSLTLGRTKSCGCLRRQLVSEKFTVDMLGKKFGRLTVVKRNGSDSHNNALWLCKCDCGNPELVSTTTTSLLRGHTQSCGCFKRDQSSKAHTKYANATAKYLAIRKMASMKDRCLNPNCKCYPNWGGRGITICKEWLDDPGKFAEWALSHGYEKGLSIDRIDNNGPYSPENCRFVTNTQQAVNKRNNRWITIGGETKTISQWAQIVGVPKGNFYQFTDEEVKEKLEKLYSAVEKKSPPQNMFKIT